MKAKNQSPQNLSTFLAIKTNTRPPVQLLTTIESIPFESYNAINQPRASQLDQRSKIGTETVFCPPNPNISMMFDDDEQHSLTPRIGITPQYPSHIPQRHNHPIQLCQQQQPTLDRP